VEDQTDPTSHIYVPTSIVFPVYGISRLQHTFYPQYPMPYYYY
jgi:hypothetical protein